MIDCSSVMMIFIVSQQGYREEAIICENYTCIFPYKIVDLVIHMIIRTTKVSKMLCSWFKLIKSFYFKLNVWLHKYMHIPNNSSVVHSLQSSSMTSLLLLLPCFLLCGAAATSNLPKVISRG